MIKLSILDQSPIRSGGSHADAIAETLQLAQAADRFGYSRYWVAEHHNSPRLVYLLGMQEPSQLPNQLILSGISLSRG